MYATQRKPSAEETLKSQVRTFILTEAQKFMSTDFMGTSLKKSLLAKGDAFVAEYQKTMLGLGTMGMAKMRAGKLTAADIK